MSMKEAMDILFENTPTELIHEAHNEPDFYEFHVSMGGDAAVYRVYKKDGKVYEK